MTKVSKSNDSNFIDLSHKIENLMPTYPSDPEVLFTREKQINSDNTLLHNFSMGTHTGSHLDVPAHIIEGGKTLDKFSLENFTGRSIKISFNEIDDIDDLKFFFDIILYDTGWSKKINNPNIFYGSDRPVIPNQLIDKCINNNIKAFGCDLPSVDKSGSINKPIHNTLLNQDIIIYESLNNLDKLPILTPFDFFGFPLPLDGLDGCPVRAVARV